MSWLCYRLYRQLTERSYFYDTAKDCATTEEIGHICPDVILFLQEHHPRLKYVGYLENDTLVLRINTDDDDHAKTVRNGLNKEFKASVSVINNTVVMKYHILYSVYDGDEHNKNR